MKLSEFMKCTILFFPLVASTPQSATAGDFDLIWRASEVEMGPVSWTGFIFNPEVSYNTLNLNGPGGEFLSDPKGFRAGLELGYDYQIDNLVVGVAGDGFYSWMDGGSSDKVKEAAFSIAK